LALTISKCLSYSSLSGRTPPAWMRVLNFKYFGNTNNTSLIDRETNSIHHRYSRELLFI